MGKKKFVVPELPEVPDPVNTKQHVGNWLWRHYDDHYDSYRNRKELERPQKPLTDPVTSENPLKVDVCDSIRSPYSYFVVDRLAYLQSNFNCNVEMHVVFPVAIRSPYLFGQPDKPSEHGPTNVPGGLDEQPTKGGRWYKFGDLMNDCHRLGEFHQVPFQTHC